MEPISKPIIKFLKTYEISKKTLPANLFSEILSSKDAKDNTFEYTLTSGNLNYRNENIEKVPVKDIVGTMGISERRMLIEFMSELYNDKSEYGKRSLSFLNMGVYGNIDVISNSNKPIKLAQIGDKYYVSEDGNHRTFYLLFTYYLEKEKYKDNPEKLEQIEEKFSVNMLVRKKSPYRMINNICYCMSKCWNDDLKITFTSNEDKLGTLFYKGREIDIRSENEFVIYFIDYLSELDKNSKKYQELLKVLTESGFVGEIVDVYKNSSDIVDMVIENNGNTKKGL